MAETLLSSAYNINKQASIHVKTLHANLVGREDAFASTRLIQAVHYKKKDAVAHEFLILRFFDGNRYISLRAERFPSKHTPEGGNTRFGSSVSLSMADDVVTQDPQYEEAYRDDHLKLSSSRCPPRPFISFHNVCDILYSINKDYPNYHLTQHQCYWFCAMFLRKLEKKLQLAGRDLAYVKGKDHDLKGVFYNFKARPIMSIETVNRDIERALENEEAQQRRSQMDVGEIRDGIAGMLAREEVQKVQRIDLARRMVGPLFVSGEGKKAQDTDVVREKVGKMWARKGDSLAEGENVVKGMDDRFMADVMRLLGSPS